MSDTESRIQIAWQEHLRHEWAQIAEWDADTSFAEFAEWYEGTTSAEAHRARIEAREHFRDVTGPLAGFLERWVVKPLARWLERRMGRGSSSLSRSRSIATGTSLSQAATRTGRATSPTTGALTPASGSCRRRWRSLMTTDDLLNRPPGPCRCLACERPEPLRKPGAVLVSREDG